MIAFLNKVSNAYWRLVTQIYFRPQFGCIGERTIIRKPMLLRNVKGIRIGARCGIRDGARIELVSKHAVLEIGDDVSIEQHVHISCMNRITIGNRVTFSARCTIVDVSHPYEDLDATSSVGARLSTEHTPVLIEEGAFIGIGVVILPKVTLGKHCVVGANSVVTKSVPAYTVVAGVPAKVVKHYDPELARWVKG